MNNFKNHLHTLWHHIIWHAILLPIFWVFGAIYEYVKSTANNPSFVDSLLFILKEVASNPLIWAFLIFGVTLVRISIQLFEFIKNSWMKLKQLETLVYAVGLRSFSAHDSSKNKSDWEICEATLKKSKATQLCILGAAGYETFSSNKAPLYSYINDASCELKVLLLNPESNAFKQRCMHVGVTESKYRNWIYNSIEFCKNLKDKKNLSVEVRLYDDYPIWKMIFTPEYMWLQWYQNKHVDQTHVYSFQTAEGVEKTSLYYPLTSVFRRRWDSGTKINLENWTKPVSQNIKKRKSRRSK